MDFTSTIGTLRLLIMRLRPETGVQTTPRDNSVMHDSNWSIIDMSLYISTTGFLIGGLKEAVCYPPISNLLEDVNMAMTVTAITQMIPVLIGVLKWYDSLSIEETCALWAGALGISSGVGYVTYKLKREAFLLSIRHELKSLKEEKDFVNSESGRDILTKMDTDDPFFDAVIILARRGLEAARRLLWESSNIKAGAVVLSENMYENLPAVFFYKSSKTLELDAISRSLRSQGKSPIFMLTDSSPSEDDETARVRRKIQELLGELLQSAWGTQSVFNAVLYLAGKGYNYEWLRTFTGNPSFWNSLDAYRLNKSIAHILPEVQPQLRGMPSDYRLSTKYWKIADDEAIRKLFISFFFKANLEFYLGNQSYPAFLEFIKKSLPPGDDAANKRMLFIKQWNTIATYQFEQFFPRVWDRYQKGHEFFIKAKRIADKRDQTHFSYGSKQWAEMYLCSMQRIQLISGRRLIGYYDEKIDSKHIGMVTNGQFFPAGHANDAS
jgi:hypothetical protein